jgi:nicotinamidase-related amidase
MGYSEDEVLIFAGAFADECVKRTFPDLVEDEFDRVRNLIADAVEPLIRNYDGFPSVPLPKWLRVDMDIEAHRVIIII